MEALKLFLARLCILAHSETAARSPIRERGLLETLRDFTRAAAGSPAVTPMATVERFPTPRTRACLPGMPITPRGGRGNQWSSRLALAWAALQDLRKPQ